MVERVIFHIDVNSAFLAWSAVHHLRMGGQEDYRTMMAAVAKDGGGEGRGIILAKSEAAKKMGVKTGEAIWLARQKCPSLRLVSPDYHLYLQASENMKKLLQSYSPAIEPFSIDECFLDYTGQEKFFGAPVTAAQTIRRRIRQELGFTVNIGVGHTKALAKMASSFEKPDRVHTLWRKEIDAKLWPLPIDDLFMVGRHTSAKIKRIGLLTIGDLAQTDPALLKNLLGKQGETLWLYANGLDDEPVREGPPPLPKSMSKSITLPHVLADRTDGEKILLYIAGALGHKLRQKALVGQVVTVAVKDGKRCCQVVQRRLAKATCYINTVYREAVPLLAEVWPVGGIRFLSLTVADLRTGEDNESDLFTVDPLKQERLEAALYNLRCRYGRDIVQPATLLNSGVQQLFRPRDENDGTDLPPRFF